MKLAIHMMLFFNESEKVQRTRDIDKRLDEDKKANEFIRGYGWSETERTRIQLSRTARPDLAQQTAHVPETPRDGESCH
jgi:hypothetical protein